MFDGQPKQTIFYTTAEGKRPFVEWHEGLSDQEAFARVAKRLDRLRRGNPGEYREVGGVYELKIDYGPGYRVYFAFAERELIVLLGGGDKRTQAADIKRAFKFWRDYQARQKQ